MRRILYILAIALSVVACTDDIDKSNRYTFTGETIADFLLNRSDKYSHFITMLKQANLLGLMSTYGQYTLFLPDNDAVEKYVQKQDSIYHATKDTEAPIWTGITSPLIEDLTDSMATVIARNHLIDKNYHTADFGEGAIPKWNFNDRTLVINYKVTDERFYIMLNNNSAIISGDNDVENGVIHIIDTPISPLPTTLAGQIEKHKFFSLFNSAIKETGFADIIAEDRDITYKVPEVGGLIQKFIPTKKYIKYTAFIEPDEVFHKNGIHTLDDLKAFAEKWYGTEDKNNYKSPRNALYKFVAYHFVEGEIPYNKIVFSRHASIAEVFDIIYIPGHDQYNYYPTMMGKMMKALKPLSQAEVANIYLNYSKRKVPYNLEMRNHLNVRVIELTEFTQMSEEYAHFVPTSDNGLIHPIDKILIYNDDEMVGNILNERIRLDLASLQPEFSSNNIWQNGELKSIPNGYCKGIKNYIQEQLPYEYSNNYYGWMGDCLTLLNMYDLAFKLPPLPSRTYEIRVAFRIWVEEESATTRLLQIYFDGKVCCSPIDLGIYTKSERVGWKLDNETYDNGVELDKQMRNRGWMKAPDVYKCRYYGEYVPVRNSHYDVRKIICIKHLVEGEHWIRFRNINEYFKKMGGYDYIEGFLDYIEFVPLNIINDPTKPEDRH